MSINSVGNISLAMYVIVWRQNINNFLRCRWLAKINLRDTELPPLKDRNKNISNHSFGYFFILIKLTSTNETTSQENLKISGIGTITIRIFKFGKMPNKFQNSTDIFHKFHSKFFVTRTLYVGLVIIYNVVRTSYFIIKIWPS